MKRRSKSLKTSLFDALSKISFLPYEGMFDLLRGEVEKVFINTKDANYTVGHNQVVCTIDTVLKVRYKSGEADSITTYKATGVSKCAPDDKFNLLTGIKLATARAENDYNTYYFKLIDKYFKSISTFASRMDCLRDKCMSQLIHNNQHFIPSLIDKENK